MAAPEASPQPKQRGTARAVFWGLLLCLPVCYWNMWQNTATLYSLIFSTMGALIVLVAALSIWRVRGARPDRSAK